MASNRASGATCESTKSSSPKVLGRPPCSDKRRWVNPPKSPLGAKRCEPTGHSHQASLLGAQSLFPKTPIVAKHRKDNASGTSGSKLASRSGQCRGVKRVPTRQSLTWLTCECDFEGQAQSSIWKPLNVTHAAKLPKHQGPGSSTAQVPPRSTRPSRDAVDDVVRATKMRKHATTSAITSALLHQPYSHQPQ